MPTYEYRCPNGHDFEKFFRTISASEPERVCPTCGEKAQRRISGGAGLLFKGSGFYLTDYGKNAHATRGDAKPSGSAEATSKSSESAAAPKSGDSASAPASTPAPSDASSSGPKPPPKKAD